MMIRKLSDFDLAKKILKRIPLFEGFSDQELSRLLQLSNISNYSRDEIIIMAEEDVKQMYIMLKGQARVVSITMDGQERVMALRHRGDYFGDMGLLDCKTDSATVIAVEPCTVLLITKSVFDEFFMANRTTLIQIIEILCGRLRESWLFHNIIGINNSESKIRATLAHYSETLGAWDNFGVIINSNFSHQSLADRVHITRETVSRVLKRLKDQNEIEMVGRRFKLLPTFFDKYEESELFKSMKVNVKITEDQHRRVNYN